MNIAQEQADIQRAEAKEIFQKLFKVHEGFINPDIDRAVDCIISAALLEAVIVMQKGMQGTDVNTKPACQKE
jgi:hypothetical protein